MTEYISKKALAVQKQISTIGFIFISSSVMTAVTNMVFALLAYQNQNWLAFGINVTAAVVVSLNLIMYPLLNKNFFSANVLFAAVVLAIFLQQVLADQPYSHIYLWGCLIPIFAAILTNKIYSFIWALASMMFASVGFLVSYHGTLNLYLPFEVTKIITYYPDDNFIIALNISILGGVLVAFFVAIELKTRIKKLYNANQKNQLLLNILTHDVSTPLQVLRLGGTVLERNESDEKQILRFGEMQTIVDQLDFVLNEVRSINALAVGKVDIALEKFSVEELLEDLSSLDGVSVKFANLSNPLVVTNKVIFQTKILNPILKIISSKNNLAFIAVEQNVRTLTMAIKHSMEIDKSQYSKLVGVKVVCQILHINFQLNESEVVLAFPLKK